MTQETRPTMPRIVVNGLKSIVDTGKVNMFDFEGVQQVASLLGLEDTTEWLRKNREVYPRFIFYGEDAFEIVDGVQQPEATPTYTAWDALSDLAASPESTGDTSLRVYGAPDEEPECPNCGRLLNDGSCWHCVEDSFYEDAEVTPESDPADLWRRIKELAAQVERLTADRDSWKQRAYDLESLCSDRL